MTVLKREALSTVLVIVCVAVVVAMATNVPVNVKYTGSLKQWHDAIFLVPLENIIGVNDIPTVGDEVKVKKRNRFGRVRVWSGVVVSEMEASECRKLLEENDLLAEDISEDTQSQPNTSHMCTHCCATWFSDCVISVGIILEVQDGAVEPNTSAGHGKAGTSIDHSNGSGMADINTCGRGTADVGTADVNRSGVATADINRNSTDVNRSGMATADVNRSSMDMAWPQRTPIGAGWLMVRDACAHHFV